jgi:hypothetical protein
MSKKHGKSPVVSARVTQEDAAYLDNIAAVTNMTRSQVLRELISKVTLQINPVTLSSN